MSSMEFDRRELYTGVRPVFACRLEDWPHLKHCPGDGDVHKSMSAGLMYGLGVW